MTKLTIPDVPHSETFNIPWVATTTFNISFPLFSKDDLRVEIENKQTNVITVLDESQFTFTGTLLEDGGYMGGTVELVTAVASVFVRISRDIEVERTANLAPASTVTGADLDREANRLTAIAQEKLALVDLVSAKAPLHPAQPGIFRIGDSSDYLSYGDELGNQQSPFAFLKNRMSAEGTPTVSGSEWVLHVGGYVPPSGAPAFSEQKGGIEVAVRSGRESIGTAKFSDLTGVQINTNLVSGVQAGRSYGLHVNNTLDTNANGQAIGAELEVRQESGGTQPNLFSNDQKIALHLVPVKGGLTKGIMFGANLGGTYHTLMYVDPQRVQPALETPQVLTNPAGLNYGGSFFRAGDVYRQCRIGDHLVEANGLVQPRYDESVVQHARRSTGKALSILEIPAAGGSGQAYHEYAVTGGASKSAGIDRASGEYRISNSGGVAAADILLSAKDTEVGMFGSGASAPVRFRKGDSPNQRMTASPASQAPVYTAYVKDNLAARSVGMDVATTEFRVTSTEGLSSNIIMAALPDRVAWFGTAPVTGGTKLHWTANGVRPSSIDGGTVWWFENDGKLRWQTKGYPVRVAAFTEELPA